MIKRTTILVAAMAVSTFSLTAVGSEYSQYDVQRAQAEANAKVQEAEQLVWQLTREKELQKELMYMKGRVDELTKLNETLLNKFSCDVK